VIPWTAFERRWRDALLSATIPPVPGIDLPAIADLDLGPFWVEYARYAPFLVRMGFRLAVWLLTLLPLFLGFGPRLFHRLSGDARDAFLVRASASGSFLVRQFVMTVKIVACLAYFRDAGVRRRFEGAGV
jgi:hypothetical protein